MTRWFVTSFSMIDFWPERTVGLPPDDARE
jgi:hypothetical protein